MVPPVISMLLAFIHSCTLFLLNLFLSVPILGMFIVLQILIMNFVQNRDAYVGFFGSHHQNAQENFQRGEKRREESAKPAADGEKKLADVLVRGAGTSHITLSRHITSSSYRDLKVVCFAEWSITRQIPAVPLH
ncbi:hypothetical protein ACP275_08G120200 [Erythranthe tilingii]